MFVYADKDKLYFYQLIFVENCDWLIYIEKLFSLAVFWDPVDWLQKKHKYFLAYEKM